jgi:Histidine kinase-, DNA gyrase B-, and HSP90-like ATPase
MDENENESKNKLVADTRPTKVLMVSGITRDLSIDDCIFDLIDNAIDAQTSDSNNKIVITFNFNKFSIEDHGSGISLESLQQHALRFGILESHQKGIGAFGVGLNRAIFKLAKKVDLITETTETRLSVGGWDIVEYLNSNELWEVPIKSVTQTGKTGTLISITDLNDDVKATFSDASWEQKFLQNLSKRYGYLIEKNKCVLTINDVIISSTVPAYRIGGDFELRKDSYTIDGIEITIKLGQLSEHRFSYEDGYDKDKNQSLTEQYGWNVYCNDRGILLSDRTHKTGWDRKYHTQHYGFIGELHLSGEPRKLPWSTSKADIDLHNQIYVEALTKLKQFSLEWRSHTDKVRYWTKKPVPQTETVPLFSNAVSGNMTLANINSVAQNNPAPNTAIEIKQVTGSPSKFNPKPNPNDWPYLFGPYSTSRLSFNVPTNEPKLCEIVDELRTLTIKEYSCAIMLLIRVLIEGSTKHYISRNSGKPSLANNASLADKVSSCTDSMKSKNFITDGNEFQAIKSLCSARGEDVLSIEYLQNSIHSKSGILGPKFIRPFWCSIEPYISACFRIS